MKRFLLTAFLIVSATIASAQPLQLLDRFNGNKLVNDSTITVFGSDFTVPELTQYFTMKNNTEKTLAVYLRKTVNFYADSTIDYYCFGIRCWPGDDSTNVADSIPPGGEDYTFASHVTHFRRFDFPQPSLPPGVSSITYTVYDKTSFPEPVEATVTVIYHLGGLGVEEAWGHGGMEAGEQGGMEAGNVVHVFPNPATDWVTVEFNEFIIGVRQVLLFNNLGGKVSNFKYNIQDNRLKISVAGFPPGLYLGRIVTDPGRRYGFKFQVSY